MNGYGYWKIYNTILKSVRSGKEWTGYYLMPGLTFIDKVNSAIQYLIEVDRIIENSDYYNLEWTE